MRENIIQKQLKCFKNVSFHRFCLFLYRAANPPQANWCTIWDGKPSKIFILAVHYAWSVYVLNFNCVVLNIRAYGRDHLSINTVAIGFSEIIGVFIGIYFVLYTSRRWLWAGLSGIASGFLAYFTWFIPQTREQTPKDKINFKQF